MSFQDIFVGMPRDEMDRVEWLLEHGRYGKALSVATVVRKRDPETWERVVDRFIDNLLNEKKVEEAAKVTPELLGEDAVRWERYVFLFASKNNLSVLSSYVPIENPTLKPSTYNMILRSAARRLSSCGVMCLCGPQIMYSVSSVSSAAATFGDEMAAVDL